MTAIHEPGPGFDPSTMAGEVHHHNLSTREAELRRPTDLLIKQSVYTSLSPESARGPISENKLKSMRKAPLISTPARTYKPIRPNLCSLTLNIAIPSYLSQKFIEEETKAIETPQNALAYNDSL